MIRVAASVVREINCEIDRYLFFVTTIGRVLTLYNLPFEKKIYISKILKAIITQSVNQKMGTAGKMYLKLRGSIKHLGFQH